MKQKIRISILMLAFTSLHLLEINAQAYRMEIGLAGGASFYMGDANQNALFKDNRASFGVQYRYNLNGRFAVKANVGLTGISGSTAGIETEYPSGVTTSFNRQLLSTSLQVEMNFYEFGVPAYIPGFSIITPFISTGVGLLGFQTSKTALSPFIPFGLGLKLKFLKRYNLGCEWSFKKTYTDNLDASTNGSSFSLVDPWLVQSSIVKNKDWYSELLVSLSIDLVGTRSKCFR